MKFYANQKKNRRSKFVFLPIFFLILFACATIHTKTYEETVSGWKSYKDVARWFSTFSYDMARFRQTEGKGPAGEPPRTPQETFKLKSGICYDGAFFAKDALNRIDPSYDAKVLWILNRPYNTDHFVCSFKKDEKLFIMDYATYYTSMAGVHGPFSSLNEYKKFYERYHPKVKHVQSIAYW